MKGVETVKDTARGRWVELLVDLGGIPPELLDGKHRPCPKCGGTDRFRLINEEEGAVLCNQCFNERNGDGFSALQWILGKGFREVLDLVADRLGVDLPKNGTGGKARKDSGLELLDWNDDLVALWCLKKLRVIPEAVRANGGRLARWFSHQVIAIPIVGHTGDPRGWAMYNSTGGDLPSKSGPKKVRCTSGSKSGWLGSHGLERIKDAAVVWKVEGVSDMLALWSAIPSAARTKHVVISNPFGAGEKPKPELLDILAGKTVVVIADNDKVGQSGGERWAGAIAHVATETRLLIIPGPGKDLRDWLVAGGAFEQLREIARTTDPTAAVGAAVSVGEEGGKKKPKPQADRLIELAMGDRGAELFHSPDMTAYARVSIGEHAETWPVKSRSFRLWLARRYFEEEDSAPNSEGMNAALHVLEGRSLFDGAQHDVHVRLAEHDGDVYLDVGDPAWRAIRVDADGWKLIDRPSVRFRRPPGLLPLPFPEPSGNLDTLWKYVNVTKDDRPLVVAWLTATLRPMGPYCVLLLHGGQGSAKSATGRALRGLVDPNVSALRAEPREGRDLMIAASNGWVLGFDNISKLRPWLSDAFCRLSTGGGFSTRQLYSDGDEVLIDVQRPILVNGITDLIDRADLLERSILLALPLIDGSDRRAESDLWASYDKDKGYILGALLDLVSAAMRELPNVQLERLPRMADFALWGAAVERAIGWAAGTFEEAYRRNREDAETLVLESEPVAIALLSWFDQRELWEGTATTLLGELRKEVTESVRVSKKWPRDASGLSGRLKRSLAALSVEGIGVEFVRTPGGERTRTITLRRVNRRPGRPARPEGQARPERPEDFGHYGQERPGRPETVEQEEPPRVSQRDSDTTIRCDSCGAQLTIEQWKTHEC